MTCWWRLRDRQADGTWAEVHAVLLARLHAAGKFDWPRPAGYFFTFSSASFRKPR
jgi:hypothetical protein